MYTKDQDEDEDGGRLRLRHLELLFWPFKDLFYCLLGLASTAGF
jgi:hypothetical protein